MSIRILEKSALAVSGLTAVAIGTCILAAPHAFYSSYGIHVGDDASLLSELRAPAAGLATLGVLMLVGIWRPAMTTFFKVAALTVFCAFPAGRIIGVVIDGLPSGPIIGALLFELAVAGFCVVAFSRRADADRTRLRGARSEVGGLVMPRHSHSR